MVVIITGAASGIGRSVAEEFLRRPITDGPVRLALVDLATEPLERAAAAMRTAGADVLTICADLAQSGAGARIVEGAVERFGELHAVISNAGMIHAQPLATLSSDAFDRIFAVNVRATFELGQAARPNLARTRGALVATASTAAEHPFSGLGGYSASKAALVMLVRQMAAEWGPDGVRCNCVSPGPTHTGMTGVYDDPDRKAQRGAEIPLGRVGAPEDIARAIRFLASPEAAHISGVNLRVDGGLDASLANSRSSAARRTEAA